MRLIAADAAFNEHVGLEYAVGEVWEVGRAPAEQVIPPHVENIVVRSKRRLGPMTDPVPFIETHMPPAFGGADLLYEGLAQAAHIGRLVHRRTHRHPPVQHRLLAPRSAAATRRTTSKRIRYRYPSPDGGRTLTFVGFQEPIETIPAGTLVRVSLAHWWRPEDDHTGELRCYVQLSGWFLPKDGQASESEPATSRQIRRRPQQSTSRDRSTAPTMTFASEPCHRQHADSARGPRPAQFRLRLR